MIAPPEVFNNNQNSSNAIHNIGALKTKYPRSWPKYGTAVIIGHGINTTYILTAASNVVYYADKAYYAEDIWFCTIKQNYSVFSYEIHPKYDVKLVGKYNFAVLKVKDERNELKKIKPILLRTPDDKYAEQAKLVAFRGCMSFS